MTKALALLGALASMVALVTSTGARAVPTDSDAAGQRVHELRPLSLEVVGQFQNSPPGVTPPTHIHYGYLSYIRGLTAFNGAPQDERTALFTFYSDAATPRVIANGPLRVITRVGRVTIYRDPSPNGDFGRPASFRDGAPVLVAQLRQQVIANTVTGSFTTFHQNTIVTTRSFATSRGRFRLGRVRDTFRTYFDGQTSMPGPPSGYFGGYAVGG